MSAENNFPVAVVVKPKTGPGLSAKAGKAEPQSEGPQAVAAADAVLLDEFQLTEAHEVQKTGLLMLFGVGRQGCGKCRFKSAHPANQLEAD
jgi:hypothetical protein